MSDDWREIVPVAPELFVADVTEAVRFYTKKLGFTAFRVENQGGRDNFAIVAMGKAVVMFAADYLYEAMGGSVTSPRGVAIDIRIMVDDVEEVHRRCVENEVTIVHPIADRYYGLRDFVVVDPNGFRLRFAAPLSSS